MTIAHRTVEISNRKGLHARASAALAREALKYQSTVMVSHEGAEADAASIMDLLMLTAHLGCTVELKAQGSDAEEAVEALAKLIANRFGEDD